MNSKHLNIKAITAFAIITTTCLAQVEEVDLSADDDSAEIAMKTPTIQPDANGLISISCDNIPLATVLQQFRKATNVNILNGDSTNLFRKVSAKLSHVRWNDALQSILGLANFKMDERHGIWYVSEKTASEVHNATRYYVLKHASAVDLADLFNGISMKTSYAERNSIRSSSAKAQELSNGKEDGKEADGKADTKSALAGRAKATAFPNTNTLVLTGPEANLIECERIIDELDRPVTQVYIEARFIELSSQAMHKLGVQWNQLESWGASVKNLQAGYQRANGTAANYGMRRTQRTTNKNTTKTTTTSGTTSASSSGDSSANANDNNTETTTTSDNNTYVGIVPTELTDAVGGSMAWKDADTFSGLLSADDFRLAISAFEQLEEGKLFSNPRIIVANGKEAKVDMTTKEPNVEVKSSRSGSDGQSLDISTKLETIPGNDRNLFAGEAFFSYGISLSVKPRVSSTGLISVEVVPTISEKKDEKHVAGAGTDAVYTTYPIINVKTINTEFTMKDGATAVIGGLTQTTEADVDSGIPYLRKIPWIGPKLFGWQSRQKIQSEILVCVTVGIANPETLRKDAGLPTNAVLGREYVEGRRFEPGERPNALKHVNTLDTRTLEEMRESPYLKDEDVDLGKDEPKVIKPEEPVTVVEPIKIEEPKPVEPPKVVETPKPVSVVAPVKVEEPKKVEEPVKVVEPTKVEEPKPTPVVEPKKVEPVAVAPVVAPAKVEESVTVAPVVVPTKVEEPKKVEEPVVSEPTEAKPRKRRRH